MLLLNIGVAVDDQAVLVVCCGSGTVTCFYRERDAWGSRSMQTLESEMDWTLEWTVDSRLIIAFECMQFGNKLHKQQLANCLA